MQVGDADCSNAAGSSSSRPSASGNGGIAGSSSMQARRDMTRDMSAPSLTRKASQSSLHRSGGSTPGVPPPLISGGSSYGGASAGTAIDPTPRGFGSSTGRGLMEGRFLRRTASVVSLRGLPRGAEREKVGPAAPPGTTGGSMGLTAGGSACSNAPAGSSVVTAVPSRSGTAPRQRGPAHSTMQASFSTIGAAAAQDSSRANQSFVRRVMADDALDVDVGLAERLRERIRSRLGGAHERSTDIGSGAEASGACDLRRDARTGFSAGAGAGNRRGVDTRPRRPPQPDTSIATRSSATSPLPVNSPSAPSVRPWASPSAPIIGTPSAGLTRSASGAALKAHSPPSLSSASSEAALLPTRRDSSPLKPARATDASRAGPPRSSSGRCQGAVGATPSTTGSMLRVRSSSSCSRTGRSPSPGERERGGVPRGPQPTRQASVGSALSTVAVAPSPVSQPLRHRQAAAPPIVAANIAIGFSGAASESGGSCGSLTPAKQGSRTLAAWEEEVQACTTAFERALSLVQIDNEAPGGIGVSAELRRVRAMYESLLRNAVPRTGGPPVPASETNPLHATATPLHQLERENSELRKHVSDLRHQLEAAQAHVAECHRTLHASRPLNLSGTLSAPMGSPSDRVADSPAILATPPHRSVPTLSLQGAWCHHDVSHESPEDGSRSPVPPLRRIFAPPMPVTTGSPAGLQSKLPTSPGPLKWAELAGSEMPGEGAPPRHPVRTPPLGGGCNHSLDLATTVGASAVTTSCPPPGVKGNGSCGLRKSSGPESSPSSGTSSSESLESGGISRSAVVTPRAITPASNLPRPVSWTAPPACWNDQEHAQGDERPTTGVGGTGLPVQSAGSDDSSPSPAPSRRAAMAAAWLKEVDPLAFTCRSDQSDSLPQKPERRRARPTSVPPLDLTGLAGSCADDSDGEEIAAGVDDGGVVYEDGGDFSASQRSPPSPGMKATGDASPEAPLPLGDHCGGSGHGGGSSTASTRAASTPSATTGGGSLSPCPQAAPLGQAFLMTKSGRAS